MKRAHFAIKVNSTPKGDFIDWLALTIYNNCQEWSEKPDEIYLNSDVFSDFLEQVSEEWNVTPKLAPGASFHWMGVKIIPSGIDKDELLLIKYI